MFILHITWHWAATALTAVTLSAAVSNVYCWVKRQMCINN